MSSPADVISEGVEKTVKPQVPEIVERVRELAADDGEVTQRQLGQALKIDKGRVSRNVRTALDAGYLVTARSARGDRTGSWSATRCRTTYYPCEGLTTRLHLRNFWRAHSRSAVHEVLGAAGMSAHVPRYALTRREAAQSLGCGPSFFEENVQPELRLVRRKSKVMVPMAEIERWLAANANHTLPAAES